MQFQHLLGIAVAKRAHTFGAEMELVARAFAVLGRDDVRVGQHLWQVGQYVYIESPAHASLLLMLQLTEPSLWLTVHGNHC